MSAPISLPLWQLRQWVAVVSEAKSAAHIERAEITESTLDVLLTYMREHLGESEGEAVQPTPPDPARRVAGRRFRDAYEAKGRVGARLPAPTIPPPPRPVPPNPYLDREFAATRDTPENRARIEKLRSDWSLEFAKRQGR